ncbi:hypothetical protein FQR65_LT06321 [Abscondita terminalis]|nr:hypothetical protein FQR65_LT06321 [Abscondita terminalis]
MEDVSFSSVLSKTQRLILGLFVLLLVDIIWVSSSELTKYIYHNEDFEKPFFSTYIKTSMFTLYMLGFCFWPPWRDYCIKTNNYMVYPNQEDENFYSDAVTSLSTPTYVPVKHFDKEHFDRSSGTESDDSSIRSVRFNKLAEVRHMSESEAAEALLARLSYQASVRAGELARKAATKLPIYKVARVAFIFCILWFFANYTYQLALAKTEAGMVNLLSSSSSLFTLILSALFPSNQMDRFTLSKFVSVCLSICGLVLVSLSDLNVESHIPYGAILALISAFSYAAYLVFLRRKVDHEDKMDIPLFFGFVGLFNLVLLWPLFFFFHYSNWEHFEWPTKHQWLFLLLNGLIGTVVSEALWLWGCFLTSSLIATVAISLTIPMTMLADIFLKKVSYSYLFYFGTIPVLIAFLSVAILAHYENWDPVFDILRCAYHNVCRRTRNVRIPELQSEQTEALISINNNEHEA